MGVSPGMLAVQGCSGCSPYRYDTTGMVLKMTASSYAQSDREGAGDPSAAGPLRPVIAWPALVAVWVLTPFMGDQLPSALVVAYWVLLVGAVLYGLGTAVRRRSWPLGIFSVLTALAWPITLFGILAIYGIN